MKINKIFTMSALCLALSACNDSDETQFNVDGGVAITGETIIGQTLTATTSDINGVNQSNVSYQWLSGGTEIVGATSSSYIITSDDVGNSVSVSANYVDNAGFTEAVTSEEVDIIENTEGVVTVSGTAESGQELTATITDNNGVPNENVTYLWLANGTDTIGTNAATITLTDNEIGKTITVTATYVDDLSFDENITSTATSAVVAVAPAAAEFTGDLSVEITSDIASDATGTITVTDVNDGEASFQVLVDAATTYGTFSITAAGVWTYTLDTTNATIAAFTSAADRETDSITLTSFDGTTTNLNIAINGVGGGVTLNKVVKLTDTNIDSFTNATLDEQGELKLIIGDQVDQNNAPVASPIPTGKMTFSFKKENGTFDSATDTVNSDNNAQFGLFGAKNSLKRGLAVVYLKEGGDIAIFDDGDEHLIDQKYTPDTWVDVEIAWDTTITATVTLSINGTLVTSSDAALPITNGAFDSFGTNAGDLADGVLNTTFRLGTNPAVVDTAFYIDNLKIYSDLAGTVLVYEEDFEGFATGTEIDDDTSTYADTSNEAVIVEETVLD